MEKYLKPHEVAEELQVHQMTVWRWIRKGKLPSVMMGDGPGTRYRVTRSDLKKFVKEIKPFLPHGRPSKNPKN